MKKIWIAISLLSLGILLPVQVAMAPTYSQKSQNLASNSPSKQEVVSLIGQDMVLYKIAKCESGFNSKAIGKAGEIGILQYMPSTWEAWTEKMNKDLDISNPKHQIEVYRWAIKSGYAYHWTCWRKLFAIQR